MGIYREVRRARSKIAKCLGYTFAFLSYYSGIIWLYSTLRKRLWRHFRIIVLAYHRVTDDVENPAMEVSLKNFNRQIKYLKKHYRIATLNTVLNILRDNGEAREDCVALTFDDGYVDNFFNVYLTLKKYGLPATFFLVSGLIDKDKRRLTSGHIINMKKDGFDFGSHTVSHPILAEIGVDKASEEIIFSKEEIENVLTERTEFFAYPRGLKNDYTEDTKSLVKETGYQAAFTAEIGEIRKGSDLFELNRIIVRHCPFFVFKARVSGVVESRLIQFILKALKGRTY